MPSSTHLVIGLGNPGPKYEDTRHNAGFRVVDALANRLRVSFKHDHDALVGWTQYKNQRLGLAKPLTFMNRSGQSVAPLCDYNNLTPADLIVVVDDLDLPIGTIRLRPEGSSGGHNGLENVGQHLGTTKFPRLRIGIGSNFKQGEQVDYVLSSFTPEEQPKIDAAIEDAGDAILTAVREDLEAAMNRFN